MFNRQDKNFGIIISIIILSIIFIVIGLFSYLYTGSIVDTSTVIEPSQTGVRMSCEGETSCEQGLTCQNTSMGKICLSPYGGQCNQLSDCVAGTSFCNGICVSKGGDIGSICSNDNQCESTLGCFMSPGENLMRCFIPEGGSRGCFSFNDCQPGSACVSNKCIIGTQPYQHCNVSNECANGNVCIGGKCQPPDINTPGEAGSFCSLNSDCNVDLVCNKSSFYNLPIDVGYCVRPIQLPGGNCNRFIGCLPVGECINSSVCQVTSSNVCIDETCSNGYLCLDNSCKGVTGILCSTDNDCASNMCSTYATMSINTLPGDSLYSFSLEQSWSEIPNVLSIREIASGNLITRQYLSFTNESESFIINGVIYYIQFTPTVTLKQVRLAQNGFIVFWITHNGYDLLIFRDFLIFVSNVTTNITLTTAELNQLTFPSNNITSFKIWSYDPSGQYYYIIDSQNNIVAFNIGISNGVKLGSIPSSAIPKYIRHYTQSTSSVYTPSDLLLAYTNTDFTLEILGGQPLTVNNMTDFEAEFSSINTINSAYYFGVVNNNLVYGTLSILPELNITLIDIPGNIGISNLVQSIANPRTLLISGNSCA